MKTGRIAAGRRTISHVAVQVPVAGGVAQRLLRQPAAGGCITPAVQIVLPACGLVKGTAGEGEEHVSGGLPVGLEVHE
nr:hypothetical protein [Thermogutta sp.]